MKKVIFPILIAFLSLPNTLSASDPIIGTWRLADPNLNITDTYREVEGDMIEFSSKTIWGEGSSYSVKFMWPKQGGILKDISGEFPEDNLIVETLDEPGQWYRYAFKDGRQVAMIHKKVSGDGNTLTITIKNINPDGKEINSRILFKRDGKEDLPEEETSNISKNYTKTPVSPSPGSIIIKPHRNRYKKNKDGTLTDNVNGKIVKRYIDNSDGTITDRYAGLMMFDSPFRTIRNYYEAEEAISELNMNNYKGYSDWRLPTALEWNSLIIDKTRAKPPALPDGHPFRNVNTFSYYWSKTNHRSSNNRKYVADLSRGKIVNEIKSKELFVWPVRAFDID